MTEWKKIILSHPFPCCQSVPGPLLLWFPSHPLPLTFSLSRPSHVMKRWDWLPSHRNLTGLLWPPGFLKKCQHLIWAPLESLTTRTNLEELEMEKFPRFLTSVCSFDRNSVLVNPPWESPLWIKCRRSDHLETTQKNIFLTLAIFLTSGEHLFFW